MELRHLRYFIAIAEEGSFLTAAQRRLNTSQPSLSRQIRDLESEVGVRLLERQARGVVLRSGDKWCAADRTAAKAHTFHGVHGRAGGDVAPPLTAYPS